MAGLPTLHQRSLLVGAMSAAATHAPDVPIAIGTQAQADYFFGKGSELSRMFKSFFKNNFANEVWGAGVAEPVGATAASGNVVVTQPPTEAGTIHLYIGGQHIPINVGASDTTGQVATAIVDALDRHPDLPVTGVQGAGTSHATATGTAAGVDLTLSAVTGTVAVGDTVSGTGVPAGTYIVSQTSGTIGGAGVYVTNQATTASAAALSFSVPSNQITLTCVWKGIGGNDIHLQTNYYGQLGGEQTPIGLTMTLPTSLSGGTGVPEFDTLIINMGETEFEYVAMPYTDSTSLKAWEDEYGFSDTGRWGWQRQHFGHVFSAKRGIYSDLINFGLTRNSGVMSIMAFENVTPSPMYEAVAAYVAKAQRALTNDPARPLQTLTLEGVLPAALHDRFDFIEINSLAMSGLAIQKVWEGNNVRIAREQTTYQLNSYGYGDDAYELVTTLATLARLLRNQRHAITSKYPRHKLANDGTRFGPGQAIVTPGIIKAELIAQYRMDEFNGLVEDTRNFKRFLLVERDPNNPNRVNVLYPPDLINQLRIFAVLAQFRLQYDRGIDVEIIGASGLTGGAPLPPGAPLTGIS